MSFRDDGNKVSTAYTFAWCLSVLISICRTFTFAKNLIGLIHSKLNRDLQNLSCWSGSYHERPQMKCSCRTTFYQSCILVSIMHRMFKIEYLIWSYYHTYWSVCTYDQISWSAVVEPHFTSYSSLSSLIYMKILAYSAWLVWS